VFVKLSEFKISVSIATPVSSAIKTIASRGFQKAESFWVQVAVLLPKHGGLRIETAVTWLSRGRFGSETVTNS
jgi:hypothetical protein